MGPAGSVGAVRVAVLASGGGSVADALLAAGLPVVLVVTDRASGALAVAERHGVPGVVVERSSWGPSFDREAYTVGLTATLLGHGIELVAMAGFMTVLSAPLFEAYPGRVLNTHPSLLPAFPGAHAVRDALAYGVKVTGCTVHVATVEVDHGPILAQEPVRVLPGDTEETLHERIKQVERVLYPATVAEVIGWGRVPSPG